MKESVHIRSILIKLLFFLFFLISCQCEKETVKKADSKIFYQYPFDYLGITPFFIVANSFFPESLFKNNYQRMLWLDKLNSFYMSYKPYFKKIKLFYNNRQYDAILYLKNDDVYCFANGKIILEKNIYKAEKHLTFFERYPIAEKKINNYTYGNKSYDFFFSIYGKNRRMIEKNLVKVKILKRNLKFNKQNYAAENLQKVFLQIELLSKKNEIVGNWIKSIGYIATYSYRKVASANKISLHSFGIAIDIIPENRNKHIYWFWSINSHKKWWTIKDDEKIQVPEDVVKIFESYGFCWGGRWTDFDIMHFEYRPELLNIKFQ